MLAEISPDIAIQGDTPRLIDEWQDVSKIWDAVRHEIDKRGKKGQFILTGSATLSRNDEERPKHSGAGRIARIRMRPMSLFESGDSSGEVSLKELMEGKVKASMTGDVGLERLAGFIVNGGWPEGGSRLVADEYIKALLESDMFKVDKVHRDSHRMSLLLRSLARNESTTCTTRKIWQDISENNHQGMSLDTMVDYLSVLDHLYVTENIPPFLLSVIEIQSVQQRGDHLLHTVAESHHLDRFRTTAQGNRIHGHRIDIVQQISARTLLFHHVQNFKQRFQRAESAEHAARTESIRNDLPDPVSGRNLIFQTLMLQRSDAENGQHIVGAAHRFPQVRRKFRPERTAELPAHDFRHFSGMPQPFRINVHQYDLTLPQFVIQQNVLEEVLRENDSAGTDNHNFRHFILPDG